MLDIYSEIFTNGRTPERAELLVELITLLMEVGYEDELTESEEILSSGENADEILHLLEAVIVRCTESLSSKLGIEFSPGSIHANTRLVYTVLKTVIYDVETYEDYDALLGMFEQDDSDVAILSNIIGFVSGTQMDIYATIITDVSPYLMKIIKSHVNANALRDVDEGRDIDPVITRNIIFYLKRYPMSIAFEMLMDYGYLRSTDELIVNMPMPDEELSNYNAVLAIGIAGIIVAGHNNHADAYTAIESIVDRLIDVEESDKYIDVCGKTRDVLEHVFVNNDEAIEV